MAITVAELARSRIGTASSRDLIYIAYGSSDDQEIRVAVLAQAPDTHDGLPLSGISNIAPAGPDSVWEVWVNYGSSGGFVVAPTNLTLLSFNTTGGTTHVTQALATIDSAAASGATSVPDFYEAIGVDDSGTPAGVDIVIPQFEFTVRATFAPGAITSGYIAALYKLTGKANAKAWTVSCDYGTAAKIQLSFAEAEVLFRGVQSPEPQNDGTVQMSMSFTANPSLAAGAITIRGLDTSKLAKPGQDYLWVYYSRVVDATAGRIVTNPVAAYVVQIYPRGDFNTLNLPK